MENESYERWRVRRLLQVMTDDVCATYSLWPLSEVWSHVEGAMQILHHTTTMTAAERLRIVEAEYEVWHQPDPDNETSAT